MNTLRGIFPEPKTIPKRNFILENKRNLRQAHEKNNAHVSRSSNEYKKPPSQGEKLKVCVNRSAPVKNSASSTIGSKPKPSSAPPKRKPSASVKSVDISRNTSQNAVEADPIRAQSPDYSKYIGLTEGRSFTSKAMQTVDINDSEALLKNSVIRYPSAGSTRSVNSLGMHKNELFETAIKNNMLHSKSLDGSKDSSLSDLDDLTNRMIKAKLQRPGKANERNCERTPEKFEKDFKAIKVLKSPKLLKAKEFEPIDPMKAPSNYQRGVLPRYLRNRRNVHQELTEDPDENCPEGHITLPEEERKETLGVLRGRFAELVAELNRMPVRTDTLRQKKRKMELEEELMKLEEGIKVFSRPKVYVKIGL